MVLMNQFDSGIVHNFSSQYILLIICYHNINEPVLNQGSFTNISIM